MEPRRVALHTIEPLAVPEIARREVRPFRVRKTGNSEFDVALERLFDDPVEKGETSVGKSAERATALRASEPAKTVESHLAAGEEEAAVENLPDRGPVRFSRHAQARLESRGVELGEEEREKLDRAVDALDRRGGKEGLVLFSDRAYIVGVPQRTVITVFDRSEALGHVFTNIDSTYVDA